MIFTFRILALQLRLTSTGTRRIEFDPRDVNSSDCVCIIVSDHILITYICSDLSWIGLISILIKRDI